MSYKTKNKKEKTSCLLISLRFFISLLSVWLPFSFLSLFASSLTVLTVGRRISLNISFGIWRDFNLQLHSFGSVNQHLIGLGVGFCSRNKSNSRKENRYKPERKKIWNLRMKLEKILLVSQKSTKPNRTWRRRSSSTALPKTFSLLERIVTLSPKEITPAWRNYQPESLPNWLSLASKRTITASATNGLSLYNFAFLNKKQSALCLDIYWVISYSG